MANVTITIPDQYVTRILTAINGIYPIPQVPNPEYDENPSPTNPSDDPSTWVYDYDFETPQYINEYTPAQWAKEKIKDFLILTVKRYERREAIATAEAAVDVPDGIVTT